MKHRPLAGTQAVQRAMSLLKAVADGGPEQRLSDLARQSGLNKTTAFRLLSALENAEMVERVPSGKSYRLGPELVRLSNQALDKSGLRSAAWPTLHSLAAETRETITLEVLVGDEVLILDEESGGHVIGAMPSLATRWPAHATSTGKVLLAALADEELDLRLSRKLSALTPRTVTDPVILRRELERVRVNGYATASEELEPGFIAVGAPVRSASGEVVAAISVGGPKTRLLPATVSAIAQKLPSLANVVSERLGWRPPKAGRPRGPAPRRPAAASLHRGR